jgi:hypothetical protein
MSAFVASGAVAALDVVIQLALGLGGDRIAVDDGVKVWSFQAVRKFGGLFMIWGWFCRVVETGFVRFGVGLFDLGLVLSCC